MNTSLRQMTGQRSKSYNNFQSLPRLWDDRRGIFVIHHLVDDSAFRDGGLFLLLGLSGRGVILYLRSLPLSASSRGRRKELIGEVSKLKKTKTNT